MNWYEDLYFGKTAKKKSGSLIRGLEEGRMPPGTWLVTVPPGEANQLELMPAWSLRSWYPKGRRPMVVGLACTKGEAFELVQEIVQDVLQKTGNVRLRSYFVTER